MVYDGETLESGLKLDLLIGGEIVVEVKAVEKMITVYQARLLTYLKLSGRKVGFLVNFNVPLTRDGIRRYVL